jgi:hypothetical protein
MIMNIVTMNMNVQSTSSLYSAGGIQVCAAPAPHQACRASKNKEANQLLPRMREATLQK